MSEVIIPVVAIAGAFVVAMFSTWMGIRRREMIHRERMAMIERGLTPPVEQDHQRSSTRGFRMGTVLIGLGVGLGMLIALASNGGAIWQGAGVGLLLICLGAAFILNSLIERRAAESQTGSAPAPRPEIEG